MFGFHEGEEFLPAEDQLFEEESVPLNICFFFIKYLVSTFFITVAFEPPLNTPINLQAKYFDAFAAKSCKNTLFCPSALSHVTTGDSLTGF
jgi:hypothetical protein